MQVTQAFGDRDADAGRRRPGAIGFEADHARREEPEAPRQRGLKREMRERRRFVGRFQTFQRDQIVAEADANLRERLDVA